MTAEEPRRHDAWQGRKNPLQSGSNRFDLRSENLCSDALMAHSQQGTCSHCSGTKKEPKPKLLSPDIFRWGGGLPREGVGPKKFGMALETREIKLFWRHIPGFCSDIPAVPEKFENKKFVFNFWPLTVAEVRTQESHLRQANPRKLPSCL